MPTPLTAQSLSAQAETLYDEAYALISREGELSAEDQAKYEEVFKRAQECEQRALAHARFEQARSESRARREESAGRAVGDVPGDMPHTDPKNNKGHSGRLHKYSIARAVLRMDAGQEVDGLEGETSAEISKRASKAPRGFYVPHDLPVTTRGRVEKRAILDSTTGVGAVQVVVMDEIIEALRARTLVDKLGVDIQNGLVGQVRFPKQSSLANWYWVAEGGEVGDSTPALSAQLTLTPKTIGGFADIGRRFLSLTDVAENWVRSELLNALARGIDHTVFQGTGANNMPYGVTNLIGSQLHNFGNGTTTGGGITWAGVVAMESALAHANALALGRPEDFAYVTTPGVRGQAKTTTKIANSQYSNFVWESDQTINGYQAHATTQMPSDISLAGGDTGLNALAYGHWPSMMVGFWTGIDIIVDRITGAKSGLLRVTALQDADVECRYPEAFVVAQDIKLA